MFCENILNSDIWRTGMIKESAEISFFGSVDYRDCGSSQCRVQRPVLRVFEWNRGAVNLVQIVTRRRISIFGFINFSVQFARVRKNRL